MFKALKQSVLIVVVALLATTPLFALEEISDYQVSIVVLPEGQLHITEAITVNAEHRKIKRGIYRDFPTTYTDRYGNRVRVKFEVKDVKVDGQPENYFYKKRSNGVRTYIGKKNRFVSQGEHTYVIRYVTDRQIGFFENHDELYFNAIPHGFEFPIRNASVDVYMPESLFETDMTLSAYTGRQGAKNQDYIASKNGSSARFVLAKPLGSFQGMTVVVEFPKGIVREPTPSERYMWFLKDNAGTVVTVFGTLLVLLYFIIIWNKVGRDPEPNTVIPRWEPPENYSAADVRYVMRRKVDMTAVATCVVEAAVKGWIKIREAGGNIVLEKTIGENPLSEEAQAFVDKLFSTRNSVELDRENHALIRRAIDTMTAHLELDHKKRSFKLNREYFWYGLGISFLSVISGGVINAASGVAPVNGITILSYGFLMALCLLFKKLLEAPTRSGRADLDRIAGFKQYLETAEKDTFIKLGAPDDTLAIYENFLPFAVALGVDYEWGSRFKNIIQQAIANNEIDANRADLYEDSYRDRWFRSNGISQGLSSAIQSASTPPGSSSGGGGGGFSGGGGGGGGGGGW